MSALLVHAERRTAMPVLSPLILQKDPLRCFLAMNSCHQEEYHQFGEAIPQMDILRLPETDARAGESLTTTIAGISPRGNE